MTQAQNFAQEWPRAKITITDRFVNLYVEGPFCTFKKLIHILYEMCIYPEK